MNQLLFERVATRRIYTEVVDQILRLVRNGTLKPGDQLPSEALLAEQFGVSRSSVREALKALEILGVIGSRTGVGSFVEGKVSTQALFHMLDALTEEGSPLEILEAREAVEPQVAFLAALRRTDADLENMHRLLRIQKSEISNGVLTLKTDFELHLSLADACKSRILADCMRLIYNRMARRFWQEMMSEHLTVELWRTMYFEQHQEVFAHVEAKQADEARDVMLKHLRAVEENLET